MLTDLLEITIFNAAGEVVRQVFAEPQYATDVQIADMVAMIGDGIPAHIAATIATEKEGT